MATPNDLKDTSAPDKTDNNYYLVTVDDLDPGQTYKFQFAWIYPDGRTRKDSDWSATKTVIASNEQQPNPPQFLSTDLSADIEKIFVQWNGVDNTGIQYKGIDRVEVFISGGQFDASLPVTSFKVAGKKSITAPAGTYAVTLKAVTVLGTYSDPSVERNIIIDAQAGEVIEAPTNPNGFTLTRILGGLELTWAGTYANGTFSGFEAIEVFVGTSATATSGTYTAAGVLTGDQVVNKIVIPQDGTYCRYNQPVYIHARSVNKNGEKGTLQQNVANDLLGAKTAISDDLANNIISELKLIDNAITATKISDGAISTPKLSALAITSDKIAANAITGDKILANTIEVGKLAAGTISVTNLEAGDIQTNRYLRAGTAGSARVEIATNDIAGTTILGGINVYDTDSNKVFGANLNGDVSVTGTIAITGLITTNKWSTTEFKAGNASTYLNVNTSTGATTIYSSDQQSVIDETGAYQSNATVDIPQQIIVDSESVKIQGLPGVGNGLTAIESLEYAGSGVASYDITDYNNIYQPWYEVTQTYGQAARYRTIVADPYDNNMLKRGFGIYYGVRSTAPGASTGFVGDVWVSW